MATPEGRVKTEIKKVLNAHRPDLWYDMPVPGGYGKPTLDFIGAIRTGRVRSWPFAIEAKAPRKNPTDRQQMTMADLAEAGYAVFTIDGGHGTLGMEELKKWLTMVRQST